MIYFWADTHFNHDGIIRHCFRPYPIIEDMNEALIALWNEKVRPQDTIYLLGDFGFKARCAMEPVRIFERLRGHKHLIMGNHDERNPQVAKLPWESISTLRTVKENGMRAELCHYPLETWKRADRGALMLHGHCHGNLKRLIPHRFDVGADVFRQGPVSFEWLWERAQDQEFSPADHHGE